MKRLLPASLFAAPRSDAAGPLELPSDVARESRRRVRIAAAIGALAYGVFLLVELSGVLGSKALEGEIDLAHDLLGLGLCTALLLVAALPMIGDRTVLVLALGFEVLLCMLISIAVPWAGFLRTAHVGSLTWVVPIMILFPLLVPARPITSISISILCALTMPAGLWWLTTRHAIVTRPTEVLATSIAGGVAVGIAAIATWTLYGARREIAALSRVGSYELIERLGRGGMGEVWKARHAFLARPAAVKLIRPERLQGPLEQRDAVVKRFAREAQVTASLRSPHTVELFDFGVSADGAFYYAMELLDGMNIEHFVYRFGPLAPRRVVNWLKQACHSLGEAHARGLVHRDIKPANLFVCRYGRDVDFVKVLDFGLTRAVAAPEDTTLGKEFSPLTAAGERLGTAGYMAPEQVFGLASEPRTDLYALGCVAYWLLAGRKPFEAESAGELMRLHAQAEPSRLVGAPARLEALVMACLAKRVEDRPADADRLSAALEHCLDDAPWTEADAQEWWKLNLATS